MHNLGMGASCVLTFVDARVKLLGCRLGCKLQRCGPEQHAAAGAAWHEPGTAGQLGRLLDGCAAGPLPCRAHLEPADALRAARGPPGQILHQSLVLGSTVEPYRNLGSWAPLRQYVSGCNRFIGLEASSLQTHVCACRAATHCQSCGRSSNMAIQT